jgi:hypothetical protein
MSGERPLRKGLMVKKFGAEISRRGRFEPDTDVKTTLTLPSP